MEEEVSDRVKFCYKNTKECCPIKAALFKNTFTLNVLKCVQSLILGYLSVSQIPFFYGL